MLKNKKILALLLCLVILSQASGVMAVSFTDVSRTGNTGWAYDYIMDLAEKGVINGYPDGTYKPNGNVTILETISLLYGVMGPDKSDVNDALAKHKAYIANSLTDVTWGQDRVAYALEKGVVTKADLNDAQKNGMLKNGTKVYASRYSVSMMTARALGLKEKTSYSLTYKDYNDIHKDSRGLIAALIDTGVLHKDGVDGYFLPNDRVTRAQMAKMIKVAYDWKAKNIVVEKTKTEVGQVVEVLDMGDFTSLVYGTKNSNANTSVKVDKNTKIIDRNGKTVALKDLKEYKGAEATIVYTGSHPNKVGKEIKFTTDGSFEDGVFTFVKFTSSNGKYFITLKNSKGREFETQSVYDYAKDGNNKYYFSTMRKGTELDVKFVAGIVTDASLHKGKTGEYKIEYVDTAFGRITLSKTNSWGAIDKKDYSFDPNKITVVDQNGSRISLSNNLVGYTASITTDEFSSRIVKLVVYTNNNNSEYILEGFSWTTIKVSDSNRNIFEYQMASTFAFEGRQYTSLYDIDRYLKVNDRINLRFDSYGRVIEISRSGQQWNREKVSLTTNMYGGIVVSRYNFSNQTISYNDYRVKFYINDQPANYNSVVEIITYNSGYEAEATFVNGQVDAIYIKTNLNATNVGTIYKIYKIKDSTTTDVLIAINNETKLFKMNNNDLTLQGLKVGDRVRVYFGYSGNIVAIERF